MRAGAENLQPALPGDPPDDITALAQVGSRLRHGLADPGDQLDGVAQQLAVHSRLARGYPSPSLLDDLRRRGDKVTGAGIDEAELPFDSERGSA